METREASAELFRFLCDCAHELKDWIKRKNELERLFARGANSIELREEYEQLLIDIEIRINCFSHFGEINEQELLEQ